MDNDPYLDRLVETFSEKEEEKEKKEEKEEIQAFLGCFIPSDSPLVPPRISAPLEDKLDFIVARAIYFNPRLSLYTQGGEEMLFTGEELLPATINNLSKSNPISTLSRMSLSTDMARLAFMRLLTTLPRASSSLIEISPTLVWDKDKGELREIKKTKRRKTKEKKK